jgi:hypothetical protein
VLADANEPFVAYEITHADRGGVQRLDAAALDRSTIRILIALLQGYMSVFRWLTAWGLLLRDCTGKVSLNVCDSFSPCAQMSSLKPLQPRLLTVRFVHPARAPIFTTPGFPSSQVCRPGARRGKPQQPLPGDRPPLVALHASPHQRLFSVTRCRRGPETPELIVATR